MHTHPCTHTQTHKDVPSQICSTHTDTHMHKQVMLATKTRFDPKVKILNIHEKRKTKSETRMEDGKVATCSRTNRQSEHVSRRSRKNHLWRSNLASASDPWHPGARRAPSHIPAALTPLSFHATSSRFLYSNPNSAIITVPLDTVNVNNCMVSFCYLATSCLFPMFYYMFVTIRCPWAFRKAPIHKIEDLTTKPDTCAQVLCVMCLDRISELLFTTVFKTEWMPSFVTLVMLLSKLFFLFQAENEKLLSLQQFPISSSAFFSHVESENCFFWCAVFKNISFSFFFVSKLWEIPH